MKIVGKVLLYILIGILLLPIGAIVIYLLAGLALYLIEYIYYRKKYGPFQNNNESKKYKNIGAVIILICLIGLLASGKRDFLSLEVWGISNIGAFVGSLPMVYYLHKEIKRMKQEK